MASNKTSRPDSSNTKPLPPQAFDKLYWIRVGFGVLAGVLANVFFVGDFTVGFDIGLGLYLLTFVLARYRLYRGLAKEDIRKLYTTGLLIYMGVFLVTWILIFTLKFAST
ncbi:MAG: hypothetical protein HY296_03490 [Thaumarchaeota archaeon]|nr:hypothetical protein [Nitrososphaerota archaeon]